MSYFKILFFFFLIYFTFIGWCSNNWFVIWLMMEFSFLFFVGFISVEINYSLTELLMNYFLIQVFISLMLIGFLLLHVFNLSLKSNFYVMVILSMKLGLFPFYFWMIMIFGKIGWISFLLVTSVLKLLPLLLFYYISLHSSVTTILLLSGLSGNLMGLNNLLLQKLLGYSSLIHLCWIIISLSFSLNLFYIYFLTYFILMLMLCVLLNFLNVYFVSQFKMFLGSNFILFLLFLSLSGFPPTPGFVMKWLVLKDLLLFDLKLVLFFLVFLSVFSVIFYFHMFYYIIMISSLRLKWYNYVNYFFSFFYVFIGPIMVIYFLVCFLL